MSVTVLRAVSGRGAPSDPSAAILRIPPPSMRHPPPAVDAVLALAELLRTSVPAPSLVMVALPARVEPIVAVTPLSTVKFAADGAVMVSVEPVSRYPSLLKARLLADCAAASATVPAVPVKTASLPAVHGTSAAPSNQLAELSHAPLLPRLAPLTVLLPDGLPSASQ